MAYDAHASEHHILPHAEGWQVIRARGGHASRVCPTKKEALQAGIGLARRNHTTLVIHGQNGRIQDRRYYT